MVLGIFTPHNLGRVACKVKKRGSAGNASPMHRHRIGVSSSGGHHNAVCRADWGVRNFPEQREKFPRGDSVVLPVEGKGSAWDTLLMEGLDHRQRLTCAEAMVPEPWGEPVMNDKKSVPAANSQPDSAQGDDRQPDLPPLIESKSPGMSGASPASAPNGARVNGHKKLNGHSNGAHFIAANGTKSGTAADEGLPDEIVVRPGTEPAVCVRPYRSSDHEAFCRLCCDTGFLGNPINPLFQDRELFADLFTRPYLDYEPEWVFVAEVDGEVAGYLLGSVRKHFNVVLLWSGLRTTSKMILRLVTGRYGGHPRSRRFIRWLLTSGFREQPKHPHDAAHLHIQVDKRYRGHGIALSLWEYYERRLRARGTKQCYGAFFSYPERRPEMAYKRFGFTVFDRRQTTLFQPEIREPVEVVCVCKKL